MFWGGSITKLGYLKTSKRNYKVYALKLLDEISILSKVTMTTYNKFNVNKK